MGGRLDGRPGPDELDPSGFPEGGAPREQLAFLLRYAVLAPSTHNTQPWLFGLSDAEVTIHADERRWLRLADPDRRELHISLGCALENLLVAAERFGFWHGVRSFPDPHRPELAAAVALERGSARCGGDDALFQAIPVRQTSHATFDGREPSRAHLERLQACAREPGLSLDLLDGDAAAPVVEELALRADAMQLADPDRRRELARVLGTEHFGESWLLSQAGTLTARYLDLFSDGARDHVRRLSRAPVVGVIAARHAGPGCHLEVGRLFERVALTATVLGLRLQPVSQPLLFPQLARELGGLLPAGSGTPVHVFRLGHGEPEDRGTARRPLQDVLLD